MSMAKTQTSTDGPTILVVDDDRILRWIAVEILTKFGAQVIEASNGREGVCAAMVNRPDLVLSDVVMPCLDGEGLLRALRDRAETVTIPVVLMSSTPELVQEPGNADAFLAKPLDPDTLTATVRRLLRWTPRTALVPPLGHPPIGCSTRAEA